MRERIPSAIRTALSATCLAPTRAYFRHAPWPFGKALLWNVAAHTWWLEDERDIRTRFGATMRVNARDIVGRYLAFFGVWEPNLTAWLGERLRPGDVFVDVGANVGYFTLLASHLVGPAGRVYAVEAVPSTAECLRDNLARNRVTNVDVIEAAAWHEPASLQMFCDPAEITGTATVSEAWARRWGVDKGRVTVRAAPLADLVPLGELRRARVIKIDVEGAEASAVAGLPLAELTGDIELEVSLDVQAWARLHARLSDAGYAMRVLENDYTPQRYWELTEQPRWLEEAPTRELQFDVVFSRDR